MSETALGIPPVPHQVVRLCDTPLRGLVRVENLSRNEAVAVVRRQAHELDDARRETARLHHELELSERQVEWLHARLRRRRWWSR